MRMAIACIGAALLGIISNVCGYGWITDGHFNPIGALINVLGCLLISLLCVALIPSK